MGFNLENTEETAGGKTGLYIYPGVLRVVIKGWEKGESSGGTPFIAVNMITKLAEEENPDAVKDFKFYMTDASKSTSMKKIKHIMTKVTTNANINKEVANLDEFIALLNSFSANKELRVKFSGKEYINKNDDLKINAEIGLPNFAEATQLGSEYPVVADASTKLTYDENNKYDFKRLKGQDPDSEAPKIKVEEKADTSFLDNM